VLVVGGVGWLGPSGDLNPAREDGDGPAAERDQEAGAAQVPEGDQGPAVLTDKGPVPAGARVTAFLQAYRALIDSVSYGEEDVVFLMAGRPIHFQDGRMLAADRLDEAEDFDPIFYPYPLDRLITPPPLTEIPTYSTDHLEALFGGTESEVRRHCRSFSFLDHNLFVNTVILEPLRGVEREIREAATRDPDVVRWLEELDVAYSFLFRDIAKSRTRSLHGFGLAVDLVPRSYRGRHVYWQWSRVLDREGWHRTPLSQRWSPPHAVIQAFEHHGFVWGGKWPRFDTVHFEYRPEILLYNQGNRLPPRSNGHLGEGSE